MATKGAERWSTGISLPNGLSGAMQGVGGLFAMGADAIKFTFRRPFQA
jgi:phospholipid/cholesterol/gamma-HCH transport system permease protein